MTLRDLRHAAEEAGSVLTGAAGALGAADPGAHAYGADAPGRLGELGEALHRQLANAVAARSREAAAHGARFADAAQVLGLVAGGYASAEESAHRRHREPGS